MWTLPGYEHTYRWKQFTFARKSCEQFSSHLLGLPSLQSKSQLFQQGVKCCAVVLIWYCKDAKHNSCQQQLATLKSQNCHDTAGERKRKNNKRTRNYAPKVNHNAICFQFRLFVPKGIENNSYDYVWGMRNVKVANLYSLLTGLPVGRVKGGKVLSQPTLFFRFILTGEAWKHHLQSPRIIVFMLLWYSK